MSRLAKPDTGGAVAPPNPWDPLIRISHWGIAAAVFVNGLIVKPGGTIHIWIGWAAMALLAARLVWGLVGPREARFAAFPPAPLSALRHLGQVLRGRACEYPSHNPAGAMMVYALWLGLIVVIATGLVMTGGKTPITIAEERAAVAAGDWSVLVKDDAAGDDRPQDTKLVEEVHEIAANLLLFLAVLHVLGVAAESRALGRNLVRPMIRGKDR
ncbi:cytochrome b/b6 domain-containing protein [Paracoccus aminovorans]|uniref:cytochrome b/b6 domain-containing protein n=1 Tax=Paracoccus aminovorans TaxID=34004 RepID=UPI000784DAD1|nr:cytochrome b/b6 domain-containing protein [Paracoccus aminovorans]